MQCSQVAGIDLPLKALIWEDVDGTVYLSYNHPDFLADRHDLAGCEQVLGKVTEALKGLAAAATAEDQ